MVLADFTAFKEAVKNPTWRTFLSKVPSISSGSSTETHGNSYWIGSAGTPPPASAPTTPAATDNTTVGALSKPLASGLQIPTALVGTNKKRGTSGDNGDSHFLMIDRLSHQGGLVGNIDTLQTTNLPTAALTRYTGGEGVYAAIEIYAGVGTQGTLVTVTYTNQAGTGSRTGSVNWATTTPAARMFFIIPLQVGDTGVRSVESVQLSVATVTAGDFGIVLFKPLFYMHARSSDFVPANQLPGWNTGIHSNACLQPILVGSYATGQNTGWTLEMNDV